MKPNDRKITDFLMQRADQLFPTLLDFVGSNFFQFFPTLLWLCWNSTWLCWQQFCPTLLWLCWQRPSTDWKDLLWRSSAANPNAAANPKMPALRNCCRIFSCPSYTAVRCVLYTSFHTVISLGCSWEISAKCTQILKNCCPAMVVSDFQQLFCCLSPSW